MSRPSRTTLMVAARGGATESPPSAVWDFSPGGLPYERDEAERHHELITSALATATGLGLSITLEGCTGSPPRVTVRGTGAAFGTWVDQSLAASYRGGRWYCRTEPPQPEVLAVSWAGVPNDRASAASAVVDECWADPVISGLAAFPRGLEVRWTMRPSKGLPDHARWGSFADWLLRSRPDRPTLSGNPTDRHDLTRFPRTASPEPWALSLQVRAISPRVQPWIPKFRHFIATAGRSAGVMLEFRRSRSRPLWWLASPSLIAGLWPSPKARPWMAPVRINDGRFRWPLGVTPSGRWVNLAALPHEGRHLAVLGETGMGKSSFLLQLAHQAIEQANVVLVDPIGDSARRFIQELPASATPRVVLLSPTDGRNTLNVVRLAASVGLTTSLDSHRVVGDLVVALRRVRHQRYADTAFWGPRIEDALYRVLMVVGRLPRGTLTEALDLLEGRVPTTDGLPAELGEEIRALVGWSMERPQDTEGARRLLAEVVRPPPLRRLLADPNPTWTLGDVESDGRITVVSGEAGTVGETVARTLTTIVVALLWGQLLGRSPTRKLCLVLDEAQWYAHEAVAEALRVARRLNVHVWLATQSLDSLSPGTREAVETNVADLALFRGAVGALRPVRARSTVSDRLSLADSSIGVGEARWIGSKGAVTEDLRVGSVRMSGPPGRTRTPSDAQASLVAGSPTDSPVRDEPNGEEDTGGVLPAAKPELPAGPKARDGPLRLYWVDIDATGTPDSSVVRSLGGRLGRSGSIVRTGMNERGRYWDLRPEARTALEQWGVDLSRTGDALRAPRPPSTLPPEATPP